MAMTMGNKVNNTTHSIVENMEIMTMDNIVGMTMDNMVDNKVDNMLDNTVDNFKDNTMDNIQQQQHSLLCASISVLTPLLKRTQALEVGSLCSAAAEGFPQGCSCTGCCLVCRSPREGCQTTTCT